MDPSSRVEAAQMGPQATGFAEIRHCLARGIVLVVVLESLDDEIEAALLVLSRS